MKFSVYDPDRKVYVYYEGPGPKGTHAGSPKIRAKFALGSTPEGAAWKLPSSAVKIGEGEMPIGRIASVAQSIPLGDADLPSLGAYALIAYLAWRALE